MRKLLALFLTLFLFGCSNPPVQATATPIRGSTLSATETPEGPTATITATPTVTATQFVFGMSILQNQNPDQDTADVNIVADPWTMIDKNKITIYPTDWLSDYAYEKNGGLWMVGGFGVLHAAPNGKKTWYSMKNGLPVNAFYTVAISPKNEVWIGGDRNSILHFDGTGWVDEGSMFSDEDSNPNWLCDQRKITSIDFDENGAIWILNNAFGLYTQVDGQWVSLPLGKDMLQNLGFSRCPAGLRVKSTNDITIKKPGCCEAPTTAYHYDGKTWQQQSDFSAVDALLAARHTSPVTGAKNQITQDNYKDQLSMISKKAFLPGLGGSIRSYPALPRSDRAWIATDQNNVIWALPEGDNDFYNNATGTFKPYGFFVPYPKTYHDAEEKNDTLVNFGSAAFYFQDGKKPVSWWNVLDRAGAIWCYPPFLPYPGVDQQNRLWFYNPYQGMEVADNGNITALGAINPELSCVSIGQVLPLRDGRALVGSQGVLWMMDGKNWQKLTFGVKNEFFPYLSEAADGMIYAASDTGVYKFDLKKNTFTASIFMLKKDPYTVKLLKVQKDGSIYYVNDQIVARFDGKSWKSFSFDTLDIEAATVDRNGSIWLYTNGNGFIQLAPDTFSP